VVIRGSESSGRAVTLPGEVEGSSVSFSGVPSGGGSSAPPRGFPLLFSPPPSSLQHGVVRGEATRGGGERVGGGLGH
jgi:hypothetical protein